MYAQDYSIRPATLADARILADQRDALVNLMPVRISANPQDMLLDEILEGESYIDYWPSGKASNTKSKS
jgi:hypothetical protein